MATYNSIVYEAQTQPAGQAPHKAAAAYANGKLRLAVCPYKTKGTEVAGDRINLVKLTAGCIPLPSHSRIVHRFGTPSVKVKLGAEGAGVFADMIDLGGARTNVTLGWGAPVSPSFAGQFTEPKPLEAGQEVIYAEFESNVTVSREITFYIAYVAE